MEKSFYLVIILTIIITAFFEIIFQLTYKTNPAISYIQFYSTFTVLGFLASFTSLRMYKVFFKTKEISTVNFMLEPKKLKEEIKFLRSSLIVVFIGWICYVVEMCVENVFPELFFKYEIVFSILYNSYIFSSILLALTLIAILNNWRRRISAYA
ncbi:MAG: hypothetical protein QXQ69_00380 [Candidatus Aenigmatarchaeota archaeon]